MMAKWMDAQIKLVGTMEVMIAKKGFVERAE